MNDDVTLLRRYADEGSEAAFAELVGRHVDLVYGAALRRTGGDAHRAADVAQQVFTTLAGQARKLSHHAVLAAWLHTATRNAAVNLMISEQRRKARELAALDPVLAAGGEHADWEQLRPELDAAIDELPEPDRAAVILRYLERRSFAEVGAALRVTEDAARMRTERALEKLREPLARRGITSTAAALAATVAAQPVVTAPAGLAATLASASLATVAAGTGLFATFASLMSTKTIAVATVSALFAFGFGAYVGLTRNIEQPLPPPPALPQQTETIAALRKDIASMRGEIDRLNMVNARLTASRAAAPVAAAAPAPKRARSTLSVGEQQQEMLNMLKQLHAARDQFILENGRPPANADELVGEDKYVRRYLAVDGEDYRGVSLVPGTLMTVTSPSGVTVVFDPSGDRTTRPVLPPEVVRLQEMEKRLAPIIDKAIESYRQANPGKTPTDEKALLPFFPTPQDGADFVEIVEAQRARGR